MDPRNVRPEYAPRRFGNRTAHSVDVGDRTVPRPRVENLIDCAAAAIPGRSYLKPNRRKPWWQESDGRDLWRNSGSLHRGEKLHRKECRSLQEKDFSQTLAGKDRST